VVSNQLAFLDGLARYLPVFFWTISLLFGLAQAWIGRFTMTQDGIQYLDVGDALQRGFAAGVSSYWSLLYPLLVGTVLHVVRPPVRWEFPVVHAVNFVLFVAALASFQFLLSTVRKNRPRGFNEDPVRARVADCALMGLGYSAFLYTTMDFASLGMVTPDLMVAMFTYSAAAFLLRIQRDPDKIGNYCALGLTLGMGYLAKSAFLPLTAVLLFFVATLIRRNMGGVLRWGAVAVCVALIAGPYILLMSRSKGRFTTGDSAKLNLIWMVNGVRVTNAQDSPTGNGAAIHPTRKLSAHPEIFEFGRPIGGTYPPWFNPAYWNEGIGVRFAPKDFVGALLEGLKRYQYWFHRRQTIIIGGLLILLLLIPRRQLVNEILGDWPFLALAVFPFLMYAFVTVEARYVQPSFAMLWTGLFAVALRASREIPFRVIGVVAGVVTVMMTLEAALAIKQEGGRDVSLEVAEKMNGLGVAPGDAVAIVGDESYIWARLARVRVVSEVFFNQDAWGPQTRKVREQEWQTAREILPQTGAKYLVSSALPGIVDQENWVPLGDTGVFAYKLSRP
jgi:hypothetical protein